MIYRYRILYDKCPKGHKNQCSGGMCAIFVNLLLMPTTTTTATYIWEPIARIHNCGIHWDTSLQFLHRLHGVTGRIEWSWAETSLPEMDKIVDIKEPWPLDKSHNIQRLYSGDNSVYTFSCAQVVLNYVFHVMYVLGLFIMWFLCDWFLTVG